ncbi:MAG: CHAT domain-containing protein [Bacteroidales bacterium]|nr:CHAT domain-containing protein [Bacteroidales bacterium]
MVRPLKCRLNYIFAFAFTVLAALFLLNSCTERNKRSGKITNLTRSGISYNDLMSNADTFMKASEYDSAFKYYEQAGNMLKSEQNWKEYLNILLKQIDVLRLKGNIEEASTRISEARSLLMNKLDNNKNSQADILHRKGLILMDKGNFDSSAMVFNKSIELRIESTDQNDTMLAPSYNGLGTIYFFRGDYNSALDNYTKAYTLALKRKNPRDADLARYLQNIGIINAQKGDYAQAEEAMASSLEIIEQNSSPNDTELANRYLNMGRFMTLEYNVADALLFFEKAEKILLKKVGANHPDLGSLYQNMGQAYIHMADYEKALIFFNKALAIATVNLEPGHPNILSINMNIGYVYEKKGDFTNALKYYELSLPEDKNIPAVIKTYSNMASLYNSMKEPVRADEYFDKAIGLALKILGKDHPETGLLFTRYGYFLITHDQADRSVEMFRKAYEISLNNYGKKSREASNNLTHIGNYYLIKNDLDNALKYYHEAIIAIAKDFNNKILSDNPSPETIEPDRYLVNALNGKAEAMSLMGGEKNLKNSLETYKLSIKVVEKLRSTYQNDESKLILSDEERKTFLYTVKVSSSLYKLTSKVEYLEEAFRYSDKGKSAVLFASLQDIEARQFGKIPDKIQQVEKSLKLDLGSYNRYIYEERQKTQADEGKIRFWESKVFELEGRYDSLVKVLENDYPDYYQLKYKEPDVSVKTIQKQLEKGRAVIEYTLTDSIVYIFVISASKFDLITQPIDSSFFRDIQIMRDATSSGDLMSVGMEDYLEYSGAAWSLYNVLIEPCNKLMTEKKLIIIPDSEIGYISFDMLLDAAPDKKVMDFRNLSFLIRNYVISYSASAMLQFSGLKSTGKKAKRNLLAMAPSYDNLTNLKENGFIDETGKKVYLLPIPGVEEEIKGIKKALSGNTISGPSATENRFKEIAGNYNILHLAMHTLVNNEKPMLSKLVFYQDKDTIEDGMLNTYELFGMNLNAGLAVLSACNTGTGKLMRGEGMMNLARGFIYAGVPGIVMTLWSVEDQSSAEIVEKFYEYLEDGMAKDEALRQAKLDLIDQGDPLRSHPYYWAAYVTIGDYSPMKFVKPLWSNILFGLVAILSLTGIFLTILNRKRSVANYTAPH